MINIDCNVIEWVQNTTSWKGKNQIYPTTYKMRLWPLIWMDKVCYKVACLLEIEYSATNNFEHTTPTQRDY